MSDELKKEEAASLFGTIAGVGQAVWDFASDTVSSVAEYLPFYKELEVVDPNKDGSDKSDKAPATELDIARQKEFMSYKQYVGKDITCLLAVPVWIMEPTTLLQKSTEIMEYHELLNKADAIEDEWDRFAQVVAFFVSPFSNIERPWKPFNPVLGETFEYLEGDLTFLAEQVSHHPPICAAYGHNSHFTYHIVSAPTTKLLGNSIDIYPIGRTRLSLKSSGEQYWHTPPNSKAHNLILGRTWIDAHGDFKVHNITTGASCHLYFTPCGWFSGGRYELSGHISDKDGVKRVAVSGKWNEYCEAVRCTPEGDPEPGAETRRLWTAAPKPGGDKYNWTPFVVDKLLNYQGINPLPSDSRRRPDRAALEDGDGRAGELKYVIEEMQRAERREREKRADKWAPRWFVQPKEPVVYPGEPTGDECPFWEYTGEFDTREKAAPAAPEEVKGAGFCPWQYPELHH